ncbi:CsbD family protein [Amycolatopsis solani]|uniref:CsbD family protein n=1 Tax=Amycolatopsis solani TaxID=3028615 RepID=UPI0025B0EAF8|nr:CsbD family protein [Amycolatopsis sp. MEP2-6]
MTVKHKIQRTIGSARQKFGSATGNRRLQVQGMAQRHGAQAREAAHDLRVKARSAVREAQVRWRSNGPSDPS